MDQKRSAPLRSIRDERGIVMSWLIKVVITLVVVGVLLFELVAVALVRGTAADTATDAAVEAGFAYRDTRSEDRAEHEAKKYVEKEGAEFISLSVDPEDRKITVTVRKTAKTLFIHKIDALSKYTVTTQSQTAPIGT